MSRTLVIACDCWSGRRRLDMRLLLPSTAALGVVARWLDVTSRWFNRKLRYVFRFLVLFFFPRPVFKPRTIMYNTNNFRPTERDGNRTTVLNRRRPQECDLPTDVSPRVPTHPSEFAPRIPLVASLPASQGGCTICHLLTTAAKRTVLHYESRRVRVHN